MKKSTKNALLLALFSQKPSKEEAPFLFGASVVIAHVVMTGAVLESQTLFRIGVGPILVVPFVRVTFLGYKKHKGTSWEFVYTFLLWANVISGLFFLLSLAASMADLVSFSFFCLIGLTIVEGIIIRKEQEE